MATTVEDIYQRFGYALKDESHVRWTSAEFLEWANAAQVEIVKLLPSTNAEVVTLALAAGVRQSLGATGMLLLNIVQNTSGAGITEFSVEALNTAYPSWTSLAQVATVKHYSKDAREKRKFYVYPPNNGNGSVQVLQASYPTAITGVTASDYITLADEYADAILDYCLYRAHSKDDEAAEQGKAALHFKSFMSQLGAGEAE